MLSQNQIKQVTALKVKKYREESGRFIAEGHKLVTDLLGSRYRVEAIYGSAAWIVENLAAVKAKGIPVYETLPREMERLSSLSTPPPVLAVVVIPGQVPLPAEAFGQPVLMLDEIRDPGNLGTIIRVADWFGIGNIICSETTVDLYNPKVVQATMGSIARVNLWYTALLPVLQEFAGKVPVYGTFLEGENLFEQPLSPGGIILVGNESRGISPGLEPFIQTKLFIPSYGSNESGKAESLNASIATAIICAEFRKRMDN
jgi:TrmH family RNA methyltransferase